MAGCEGGGCYSDAVGYVLVIIALSGWFLLVFCMGWGLRGAFWMLSYVVIIERSGLCIPPTRLMSFDISKNLILNFMKYGYCTVGKDKKKRRVHGGEQQ